MQPQQECWDMFLSAKSVGQPCGLLSPDSCLMVTIWSTILQQLFSAWAHFLPLSDPTAVTYYTNC